MRLIETGIEEKIGNEVEIGRFMTFSIGPLLFSPGEGDLMDEKNRLKAKKRSRRHEILAIERHIGDEEMWTRLNGPTMMSENGKE